MSNLRIDLEKRPASLLLFFVLVLAVMAFALTLDRTFLMDQQNYLALFREAPTLEWTTTFAEGGSFIKDLIVGLFSEEFLWHVWTTIFGYLLDPYTAVVVLVGALNGLIVLAAKKLPSPTLAIVLWIAIPVGLADIGLLQLRQGFAFAIMLFVALRYSKPTLGAFIAAMVHTTFTVAFAFAFIGWMFRKQPISALCAILIAAFAGAYGGGVLFDMFGGRRLLEYTASEGATSLNYVFAGLILVGPSVHWILTSPLEARELFPERVLTSLAFIHVGATMFTIFSFFFFPLGAGRVGYLTELMLIPMLPALALRRGRPLTLWVASSVGLYLVYLVGESYLTGVYRVYS